MYMINGQRQAYKQYCERNIQVEVKVEGYIHVDYEGLGKMLMEGVQASHNSAHSDQYEPYHERLEVSISTVENGVIIYTFIVIRV